MNVYNLAMDAEYVKQLKDALGDRVAIDDTGPRLQPLISHLFCSIITDTSKTDKTLTEQINDNADWIVETFDKKINNKRARIVQITPVRLNDSELQFELYWVDDLPVQAAAQAPACPADDEALKRRGLCMEIIGLAEEKLEKSMVMMALGAVKSDDVLYLHACFAIGVLHGLSESPHSSVGMKDVYKAKIRHFSLMFKRE